jgi:hypothetical protein
MMRGVHIFDAEPKGRFQLSTTASIFKQQNAASHVLMIR